MELSKNKQFVEAMESCKLSSFKNGFGHDRMGAMGNVSVNRKKVFEFHDDGWGGDPDIKFTEKGRDIVMQFISDNNIQQHIFADSQSSEYQLFKSYREVKEDYMMNIMFDYLANKLGEDKEIKKIANAKDKKIMMGTTTRYVQIAWKKSTLSEVAARKGGVAAIQKAYDELKADMKEGEQIFNAEHLKSLGVTL